MIFEVNRVIMNEAVKNVAKVAPSNAPMDILNGILIESNEETGEIYLTATNHEVSIHQKIRASVQRSGTMLINSRLLTGMISRLGGELIAMSADNPQCIEVRSGSCAYNIACLPAQNYPKPIMPFPEESVIMTGICSLAKRTAFAVSTETYKPAMQCVQVKLKNNAVHAVALDGNRIILIKDDAEHKEQREFLIPGRALQLLASISSDDDVFEVGDIGNEIVFVRGDMIFTIRKLHTGTFINTTALIKQIKPVYFAVTDVFRMREALDIISVSTSAGGKKEPINIAFGDGEIIVRCTGDHITSSTSLAANVTAQTESAGFFYDGSALLKLFQIVKGRMKISLDSKGFMMIKTRNEVYCQGPVRPRAKKDKLSEAQQCAKGAQKVNEAA